MLLVRSVLTTRHWLQQLLCCSDSYTILSRSS